MTFEGWNPRYYGDAMALPGDALAHFRTKGSKNGVRRYQQPDGTWTPLGLRLRKAREGWGETRKERRANKAVARKEKQLQKAERKVAKHDERRRKIAERRQKYGIKNLKGLSDEEVKKMIERAKLEKEYKDITRSHAVETGLNAVKYLMDNHQKNRDRALERDKNNIEVMKAYVDRLKAKADIARSKADTVRSYQQTRQEKYRFKTKKQDVKGGLYKEREAKRLEAKKDLKEASSLNKLMTVFKENRLSKIRQKEDVAKGMSFVKSQIKGINAARRHNAFRKKGNRIEEPEFDTPLKKEIRDNAKEYNRILQQTKQAEYNQKRAESDAAKAKSDSESARYQAQSAKYGWLREKEKNRSGGGKPPKKK